MKQNKHILFVCLVSILLALSFISCKQSVEPSVETREVLTKANTELTLPALTVTDMAEINLSLPQTMKVYGKEVNITWKTVKDNPHCVLQEQGKKLALKRDLKDLSYSIKATLSLNNEKLEKNFNVKVPAITKFKDTTITDIQYNSDIEFLDDTINFNVTVPNTSGVLSPSFSYTELNTDNNTMKITFTTDERKEPVTSVYIYASAPFQSSSFPSAVQFSALFSPPSFASTLSKELRCPMQWVRLRQKS